MERKTTKHDLHIIVDDPLFLGIQREADRAALCASSWVRMTLKRVLRQAAKLERNTHGDNPNQEAPGNGKR